MAVQKCVLLALWFLFQVIYSDAVRECPPPCLYVANLTAILQFPLDATTGIPVPGTKPEIFLHTSGHIRSLAVDPVKQEIYWGDFRHHSINQSSLDGNTSRSLFQYAIGRPQGMTVDWSSDVIYWTDNLMRVIEVADTRGHNRKVLFKFTDDDEPRGIVANPVEGYLFWSDWGKKARIERSSLAGEDRKTIISTGITWPNDLAIDYNNKKLFWVDAKFDALYSCDYEGGNRTLHVELKYKSGHPHPYSMAYSNSENVAYFSDWNTDSVYAASANSSGILSLVFVNKKKQFNIGQLKVMTAYNHTASRLCDAKPCSHLCLKSNKTSFSCACPTGMVLHKTGGTTCVEASREYEIYFADNYAKSVNHLVKYRSQPGFKIRPLSVPSNEKFESPVALDYDPIDKFVYWTDRLTGKTYRMHERGDKFEQLTHNVKPSYGLAVDKINKILYWFENRTHLVMSKLDGQHPKTLVKHLTQPRDIALYEEKGYIYFSDSWQGYVHRILGDGTNLTSLGSKAPFTPAGLAVDKVDDRIYWCDRKHHSVESSDLNFDNHRVLIQKTKFFFITFVLDSNTEVDDPFSVAVLGDKVFWSDLDKRAIFSVDKHSGGNIEYVTGGLDQPTDLHVFRDYEKNETKKIFLITFLPHKKSKLQALCFKSCPSEDTFKKIPEPAKCPAGYKEVNYGHSCSNCSDGLGNNFKCQCEDWMTCGQRGYGQFYGCHPTRPLIMFKIRACEQVVKPGYCPFMRPDMCIKTTKGCIVDEDCAQDEKCCKTDCSSICQKSISHPDYPCARENGGCSHFCVPGRYYHKCVCPDGFYLGQDGKTCSTSKVPIETNICKMSYDHGACHPFVGKHRWFHNDQTQQCEQFTYGGCGGNRNNFNTKEECQSNCSGSCPKPNGMVGPCVITNNSCIDNSQCVNGKLCCIVGCGKECVEPEKKVLSRCLLPRPSTRSVFCQPNGREQWWYDGKLRQCREFNSHRCLSSSENSFDTQDECEDSCGVEICRKKPEAGPCKAKISRWYYDTINNKCQIFDYGGCKGNENNFKTKSDCEHRCSHHIGTVITTTPLTTTTVKHTHPTESVTNTSTKVIASKTTTSKKTVASPTIPATLTASAPASTTVTTKKLKPDMTITNTPVATNRIVTSSQWTSMATFTTKLTTKSSPWTSVTTPATIPPPVKTKAPSPCDLNPCKNNGTCTLADKKGAVCECHAKYFGGKYCELNVEKEVVDALFQTKKEMTQEEFVKSTATVVSNYCKKSTCFASASRRRKRSSMPYYRVSEKDIVVSEYKQTNNQLYVQFAVVNPNTPFHKGQQFMTRAELQKIVSKYNDLSDNDDLTFDDFGVLSASKAPVLGGTKGRNKQTAKIVTIILVVLIVLVALAAAVFFYKKRLAEKSSMPSTSQTNDPGPVAYENQLYDDLHSQPKVELPFADINTEHTPYTTATIDNKGGAMGQATNLADYAEIATTPGYILPGYEEPRHTNAKEAPKQWVKFSEEEVDVVKYDEDEIKKVPITNFVQPRYCDPYELDGADQDYSTSNTVVDHSMNMSVTNLAEFSKIEKSSRSANDLPDVETPKSKDMLGTANKFDVSNEDTDC